MLSEFFLFKSILQHGSVEKNWKIKFQVEKLFREHILEYCLKKQAYKSHFSSSLLVFAYNNYSPILWDAFVHIVTILCSTCFILTCIYYSHVGNQQSPLYYLILIPFPFIFILHFASIGV